jgi:hypothetical protein
MCLFVLRIIVLSGSYPDAICLVSILAYHLGSQYMKTKVVSNEMLSIVQGNKEEAERQMNLLADEITKAKNSAEGIKAAINFSSRK